MKDGTEYGIGADGLLDWDLIPWDLVNESIRKLRQRIFRACREQRWNQARNLMKLMLRSYSNWLLSVRRVTQENKGRKTAGVDKEVALTSKAKMALVRSLGRHEFWKVQPARRVYIPKPGKPGEKRPLGIPTIRNRVAQAIVKNALEPCWEAQFESNSYGFRPGRSIHDAIQHCWLMLRKGGRRPWVLDADIKGAFDNILHDHVITSIGPLPGRELIKQWLKAGYVEAEMFHETPSGTPQGGIISPALLNVALDGLQKHLGSAFGYIRYADDLLVTAPTKEHAEDARRIIEEWLGVRGLKLHPEKTGIVHVNDGFNFLGFHIRRFRGKCLVKPQKEKVLRKLAELRSWLNHHKQAHPEFVILHFNRILRGWSNNYKGVNSKQTFAYFHSQLWHMIWRWCLRREPALGKKKIAAKYFKTVNDRSWVFAATLDGKEFTLFD
ncbi:MAG: group II intron reverse transcriptase/maturase, partial [Cyanobacteria bacterium]|nr:group II intron reverse transcriptase/maturase [Cyanobacteriota bacterium]